MAKEDTQVFVYWPMATYRKPDGTKDFLSTYDSQLSQEKALDVIQRWADDCDYHLISAEIISEPLGCGGPKRRIRVF